MALILGIDDAGRGPLIGPMILAGVLLEKEDESFLKKEGVDDSKKIEHKVRVKLAEVIEQTAVDFKAVISYPDEIDGAVISGLNLNTLEAMKTAEIINHINNTRKEKITVIVDCPSVNTAAWRKTLIGYIKRMDNLEVLCEHKADANHVSVSAASIIAKVIREQEVEKLKEKFNKYGNLGSGYPSDPITKDFLKRFGKELNDSGIFRKSWATWKQLFPEKNQMTLESF